MLLSGPLLGRLERNAVALQKALDGREPELDPLPVGENEVSVAAKRRLEHVFRLHAGALQALKP